MKKSDTPHCSYRVWTMTEWAATNWSDRLCWVVRAAPWRSNIGTRCSRKAGSQLLSGTYWRILASRGQCRQLVFRYLIKDRERETRIFWRLRTRVACHVEKNHASFLGPVCMVLSAELKGGIFLKMVRCSTCDEDCGATVKVWMGQWLLLWWTLRGHPTQERKKWQDRKLLASVKNASALQESESSSSWDEKTRKSTRSLYGEFSSWRQCSVSLGGVSSHETLDLNIQKNIIFYTSVNCGHLPCYSRLKISVTGPMYLCLSLPHFILTWNAKYGPEWWSKQTKPRMGGTL